MLLQIEESIAVLKEKGVKVSQKELAERIFPEKTPSRAKTIFSRIKNGYDYTIITPEVVVALCRELQTTPNKLFNWTKIK